jgi:hypothetical protein
MNEREWADRFTHEVNGLLDEARRTDSEPMLAEYRQALELARTLVTLDLSDESRVRTTLRRQLLNRVGKQEERQPHRENSRCAFWQRRPLLSLLAVSLVAFLMVALTWPGALAAAAQGIENWVHSLKVGQNTSIHQVNPTQANPDQASSPRLPATPIVEQRGDLWIIRTAAGNFAGNVLSGHDAVVYRVHTFGEAQASVPFPLRQPDDLPSGYTLREAMVTPSAWVFLFYAGPNGEILLAQYPVGRQPSNAGGYVNSAMVGTLTDQPIEAVTLNGQPAAWVEGHSLMWETDGVSYVLGGATLSLEEAIRIAESLK